jgi:hypothetical protein
MAWKVDWFRAVCIVIFLILSACIITVPTAAESVSFSKNITDPQGDVDSDNADEYKDDADILSVKTSESEGIITIELTVAGTIHTSVDGEYDEARYQFFIDINPPDSESSKRIADWMITIYNTYYQTIMSIVDNDAEHEYTLTEEDVSGDGTGTLTLTFPLEYITDDITGWDLRGDVEISISGDSVSFTEAEDDTGGSWSWEFGSSSEGENGEEEEEEETGTEDPSTETPTDTSLNVKIETAKYLIEQNGDKVKIDFTVTGTTSGVDHCALATVNIYNGKMMEQSVVWITAYDPLNDPETKSTLENLGYTAFHFKSTSDQWKTWEYKIQGEIDSSMSGFNFDNSDNGNLPNIIVYLRAFGDVEETKWNQDSKEIKIGTSDAPDTKDTGDDEESDKDGSDSGGSTPGFEAIFTLISLAMVMIILSIYRRKIKL